MRSNYQTIDEYINTFPKNVGDVLEQMRKIIKEIVPGAVEGISYQIPVFKLNGKYFVYIAGFKNHVSLYPAPRGYKEFEGELSKYKGGKGTVQFELDKPLPLDLIKRIVKFRLKENENGSK